MIITQQIIPTMPEIYNQFLNKNISYQKAQQILYDFDRNERFKVFIALYKSTLKNNLDITFKVFREAYCSSDNIYKQIKQSVYKFDLKKFLNELKENDFDFINAMNEEEKKYYKELPNNFKIYRGISQNEYDSKKIGISWSLKEEMAKNYIYFDKNGAKKGGIVSLNVEKQDILTVFSVHEEKEIIYI